MQLLGNNAANHTPKLGVDPGLDPPVTARAKVASIEGLDVVDPRNGLKIFSLFALVVRSAIVQMSL